MGTQTATELVQREMQVAHWSPISRVAFRFCFLYFGLFCLTTQILGSLVPAPRIGIPDLASFRPIRPIVFWVAAHVFRLGSPLIYRGSGSGDKTFDWILAFCLLIFAIIGTAIWSILDRKRENYVALHKWFRLFIRFALGAQMFVYGMAKVVPLQMPFPYLTKLVEPYGNFSPMGVLWSSIGASTTYEIFAGSAELLGGILLIVPRTAMFGALICLADMIQVFMLNMAYDVPVKLFSFHLLLLALFLLAPDLPRLAAFFFLNRAADPSTQPELFRSRRANRIAVALQITFGLLLVGTNVYGSWRAWHNYGGGRSKSPLYGIWNVAQISIDGQIQPPLLTDPERWRRAIFDFPTRITFQRLDDSFSGYGAAINVNNKTIALTKNEDKKWKANLTFDRPAKDQLTLEGEMDSHKIHMSLRLVDRDKFLLVNRGFHWIQEYPFNR